MLRSSNRFWRIVYSEVKRQRRINDFKKSVIKSKYEIMLNALYGRESQVIQMFAYFVPSVAGLGLLMTYAENLKPTLVVISGCTLSAFFAIGRWHICTMAYNYRAITEHCRKLEREGKFTNIVLNEWTKEENHEPCLNWKKGKLYPEMFKAQACIYLIGALIATLLTYFLTLEILYPKYHQYYCCGVWITLFEMPFVSFLIIGICLYYYEDILECKWQNIINSEQNKSHILNLFEKNIEKIKKMKENIMGRVE